MIGGVIAGALLKDLAQLAGLPVWSRKLMPEAFEQPLCGLPADELEGLQIANHLPRSPKLAARWLHGVHHVTMWGTPAAAVWIAREIASNPKGVFDARGRSGGVPGAVRHSGRARRIPIRVLRGRRAPPCAAALTARQAVERCRPPGQSGLGATCVGAGDAGTNSST